MKRHTALQSLSRDHHSTLSLAQKIIRAVQANDESAIAVLTEAVSNFHSDLELHFQKEECGVFRILLENHPEHASIIPTYLDEHKLLLNYSHQVTRTPSLGHLEAFAMLLKDHTRREERVLFPLVEECFSETELLSIHKECV